MSFTDSGSTCSSPFGAARDSEACGFDSLHQETDWFRPVTVDGRDGSDHLFRMEAEYVSMR